MEFTREAWENAPEGARLEQKGTDGEWREVHFVGWSGSGHAVVERADITPRFQEVWSDRIRIILPKRKVTVQLWRGETGAEFATISHSSPMPSWTLLGEHTFEIEGE